MNKLNKRTWLLIAEYLSGEISDSRLLELEKLAKEQDLNLDDYIKIYRQLEQFETPEPSPEMDKQFYKMLEYQKHEVETSSNRWLSLKEQLIELLTVPKVPRLAYGFIAILIGLLAGNLLMPNRSYEKQIAVMSNEVVEMRKLMVLSMIEGKQATDRIMAVNYVNDMDKADNSVIAALFKTLNNDENVNVRLASLDALIRFTNLPTVRKQLIESLKNQDSQIVLMELATVLIQIQDKNSIRELKKLLKKEDLDPSLRTTIEEGLQTFI